jgi:hypothetical protein
MALNISKGAHFNETKAKIDGRVFLERLKVWYIGRMEVYPTKDAQISRHEAHSLWFCAWREVTVSFEPGSDGSFLVWNLTRTKDLYTV